MAEIQLYIFNNTKYNLTINGTGPGNTTIGPLSSVQIKTEMSDNTKGLSFWLEQSVIYMEGTIIYGTSSGVYADRGDLPLNDQSISLQVNIGDQQWIQTSNGGSTLLSPSEFASGGDITAIFY